jgi:hypothetical protein
LIALDRRADIGVRDPPVRRHRAAAAQTTRRVIVQRMLGAVGDEKDAAAEVLVISIAAPAPRCTWLMSIT